jgi:hypothetical protein
VAAGPAGVDRVRGLANAVATAQGLPHVRPRPGHDDDISLLIKVISLS